MDRLRDDLLASAAFADHEHRDRRWRNPGNLIVDLLHDARAAPQMAESATFIERRAKVGDFGAQVTRLSHASQHTLEVADVDRLDQVIGCSDP